MKTRLAVVFCALMLSANLRPAPVAGAESYPLTCRSGNMSWSWTEKASFAEKVLWINFKASSEPASSGLASGQCAWTDRGFRSAEPSKLCISGIAPSTIVTESGGRADVAFSAEPILTAFVKSSGDLYVFHVHNGTDFQPQHALVRAPGCMHIDKIGP